MFSKKVPGLFSADGKEDPLPCESTSAGPLLLAMKNVSVRPISAAT